MTVTLASRISAFTMAIAAVLMSWQAALDVAVAADAAAVVAAIA